MADDRAEPACRTRIEPNQRAEDRRNRAKFATSAEIVHNQVEILRAKPHPCVCRIGSLEHAHQLVGADGNCVDPSCPDLEKHLILTLWVKGYPPPVDPQTEQHPATEQGNDRWGFPSSREQQQQQQQQQQHDEEDEVRIKIEFSETYPQTPPTVWICSIFQHHECDENHPHPHDNPGRFYAPLTAAAGAGTLDLDVVLSRVESFMAAPLHPCERCIAAFAQSRGAHLKRLANIRSFRAIMRTPALFDAGSSGGWKPEWFDPRLRAVIFPLASASDGAATAGVDFRPVITEVHPGVYSFPLFTPEFCNLYLDELDNYYASGLPIRRPNSMNNYGIIVNEIGAEAMIDALQATILQPVARLLYPTEGACLDHHHSFMVQYKEGQDLGLDMHTDDSDVTFNVCLGRDFAGAGLTFCGGMGKADHRQFKFKYQHVVGTVLVHLGAQRHGADDITAGERNNLIIWNHNHTFRASKDYRAYQREYEKESAPPDQRCVSYTHDKDFSEFMQYPPGQHGAHAWCPPEQFRHDAQ